MGNHSRASGVVWAERIGKSGGFGGDCCADLEERIAELEATTAKKGNRKVSQPSAATSTKQSCSGTTAEQNAYVVDNDRADPRVVNWQGEDHQGLELAQARTRRHASPIAHQSDDED
jgi:hypothetical protein